MSALPPVIEEHIGEVRALCEKYRVKRLAVFGSAVKGTFDPERSDLDFVVEFEWDPDPLERGRLYLELWDELKIVFGRNIELVVASTVRNPYFAEVLRMTQQPVYATA